METENKKLTVSEIVDIIVAEYDGTNKRSINPETNDCLYKAPSGNVCAFAFVIKPESRKYLTEGTFASGQNNISNDDFKLEFAHIGFNSLGDRSKEFWDKLQYLHDEDYYWSDGKLNDYGKEFAEEIKKSFKDLDNV